MGGISIWNLLIIAVIVVLLFGTNKLRTLGSDLGASIKGFKKAMGDEQPSANTDKTEQDADFATKSIAEKQSETKQDDAKSQHKEQV
ncbi:Sec-independent protein translocase subunit TatA [Brenneria roseae subsp. americana]|uniref:Sec-independent protein translocase protein TatA n=1 Tax=Brenneria roseae subsp. americana TaxID=1508507 RepID=A0A2U1TS47_9GAMM|nr:Sec-independent protein translocase subunit TatA [Brenneria roseae]PWC12226.1 Sec-independent protein translocase subunit TatA [Brenneria roseae subsp. americana]PWC19820.1 Sec-independent protein translocase subunit TatA [Brenneria roseae subsp. roseae]